MFTIICGFSAKLTYAIVALKTRIIFHVIDQIKVKGIVVSRTYPVFQWNTEKYDDSPFK